MATPVFLTGWEHGRALTANGGGLCDTLNGSPTIDATYKRTGSYAFRCNVTGSAAATNMGKNYTAAPVMVVRFYFMWRTAPSSAVTIFRSVVAAGSGHKIYFDPADNKIYAEISGAGTKTAALTQNQWYRLDVKFDATSNPNTIDLQLDGAAVTQLSYAQAGTNHNGLYVGFYTAVTGDCIWDDLVVSATGGDYPIGAGHVDGKSPNADGTHNAGTNVVEANDGTDIGATSAYDKLNSVPFGDETTYVKQVATGTGNYAEVNFGDLSSGTVNGVMGLLAYKSAATQANQGATIVRRSDATEISIYGTPASRADMSESSNYYKSAIVTAPGAGWSTSEFNALKARIGYSNDVSPVPYWLDLFLEVDVADASGYTLTADSRTHTLSGQTASLLAARILSITQQGLTLSGQAAAMIKGRMMAAGQGTLSLSGQVVGLRTDRKLSASQQTYALGGQVSALKAGRLLSLAVGAFALSGQSLSLNYTRKLVADVRALALSGQTVTLKAARVLAAEQRGYSLSGQAANLVKGIGIAAAFAAFTINGQVVGLKAGRRLSCAQQTYSLNGQAAGLVIARRLTAALGSLTLSGLAVGLQYSASSPTLQAAYGTFSVSGFGAGLLVSRAFAAQYQSYLLNGQGVNLPAGRRLAAAQQAYLLSGQACGGLIGRRLAADQRTYAVSGISAAFLRTVVLMAEMGAVGLLGKDANLIWGTLFTAIVALSLAARPTEINLEAREMQMNVLEREDALTLEQRGLLYTLFARSVSIHVKNRS